MSSTILSSEEFISKCKGAVRDYTLEHMDKTDATAEFDVYVVWYCKELKNHKALLSTSVPDGMYYELTYNGDTGETYFDIHKKFDNDVI